MAQFHGTVLASLALQQQPIGGMVQQGMAARHHKIQLSTMADHSTVVVSCQVWAVLPTQPCITTAHMRHNSAHEGGTRDTSSRILQLCNYHLPDMQLDITGPEVVLIICLHKPAGCQ